MDRPPAKHLYIAYLLETAGSGCFTRWGHSIYSVPEEVAFAMLMASSQADGVGSLIGSNVKTIIFRVGSNRQARFAHTCLLTTLRSGSVIAYARSNREAAQNTESWMPRIRL